MNWTFMLFFLVIGLLVLTSCDKPIHEENGGLPNILNALNKSGLDSETLGAAMTEGMEHPLPPTDEVMSLPIDPRSPGVVLSSVRVDMESNAVLRGLLDQIKAEGGTSTGGYVSVYSAGFRQANLFTIFTPQSQRSSSFYRVELRIFLDGDYSEFVQPTLDFQSDLGGVHWVCDNIWIYHSVTR